MSRPSALGRFDPVPRDGDGIVGARVDGDVDLRTELLELVDGRGTLQIGRDEAGLTALLAQQERELGRGGGLARPLQAREQDHGRRPGREGEARVAGAHQRGELVVDDLHDLLAGRDALQHLLAERLLAHARDEVLDDVEVDVGLQQGQADLPHRARNRLFVEPPALAQIAESALEPIGKRVEHAVRVLGAGEETAEAVHRHLDRPVRAAQAARPCGRDRVRRAEGADPAHPARASQCSAR